MAENRVSFIYEGRAYLNYIVNYSLYDREYFALMPADDDGKYWEIVRFDNRYYGRKWAFTPHDLFARFVNYRDEKVDWKQAQYVYDYDKKRYFVEYIERN